MKKRPSSFLFILHPSAFILLLGSAVRVSGRDPDADADQTGSRKERGLPGNGFVWEARDIRPIRIGPDVVDLWKKAGPASHECRATNLPSPERMPGNRQSCPAARIGFERSQGVAMIRLARFVCASLALLLA